MPSSSPLVWLITGAASGLGRHFALAALKRGDKVIATTRGSSVEKLGGLKAEGADILELDVTAALSDLQEVAARAIDIHGFVDVVVNSAGYVEFGSIEETTYASSTITYVSQYHNRLSSGLKRPWLSSTPTYSVL